MAEESPHLPPGSSAFAASAPVSPQGAKTKEASKPSGNDDAPHQQQQQPSEKADEKQAEKQPTPPPTIDLPLGTDLGIEAALAWTEDIGALEENFVRFSMRAASVYKPATPADAVAGGGGSVATSPGRTKHRSQDNGGDRVPSVGRSMSVKKYQKQHPRAANAGPQQQHQQQLVGRNRSVSSASGNFVPPGLRSRDQTAGGDAQKDVGGKEWLSNATVPQLKEELLVNYGQLCRLEASYQKLRDLYASVIDQLLQTREAMHQERGKRMEFESILRNYYGYVPPESQETSQQQQKQQQQQQLPAMKQSASSTSASAVPASSSSRHRVPATSGGAATTTKQQQQSARNAHAQQQQQGGMHRQPSLRRQRQTRKQHDPAADHNNDSGSDAEDAIITTVPQKATKRFIWPFGGSHSDNSHQGGSGIQAPNGGSGAGGGAGSGGSGKNSEDHGSRRQQHSFHMTSTFRAGKCDHCQERFKTFTNSVVRCRTCGFVCHQKCTGEVTASCNGSAAGQQHYEAGKEAAFDASVPFQAHALFGRDLVEQAASENRSVPWVVQAAVAFIEAEGIGMEGVYRRSGSTMDIREVQMQIGRVAQQTGNRFDVPAAAHAIADADMDVASVTSVLKQYFRDLPNPLMTSATYNLWVQAANISTPEDRVKVYRTISDSMPTAHAQTLRFLMTHLKRVADGQRENKMTTNNLSVVFAPNILHMGKGDMLQEMANMSNINKTVSFVIQHAEEIWDDAQFGGPEEDKEGESQSRQEETAAPALAPLPFMAVPPMRRQRGGGRVSDALLGDSEVLSSPSSPVHQPVATEETRADDGGLSQSMPSPTGLFLPEQQHHATGGSSGGGGLLVYSQQQTGYGSSAVHPRGSFDLHRTK
ncbi:Rho-type gtpase-activating protein [Coemansia sp. RSA 1933]|nr:Rho-type gtpase-activating protein [Coemansia sp. RSA 1933]